MEKTIIILQARTASRRLPGKVLKSLQGIPILSHSIERLKNVQQNVDLIVATSDLPQDDPVEDLARKDGVYCFRGSESDVLDRFYKASVQFGANFIVRATGDNPLVDPIEAKRVLQEINSGKWDYVCGFSSVNGTSLPFGVGVEAFNFRTLEFIWQHGKKSQYREHINDYIFDNRVIFKIKNLPCLSHNNCQDLRLTVDTPEDFRFLQRIALGIKKSLTECTTTAIIEWWKKERNG